jgi:hypothetical protein
MTTSGWFVYEWLSVQYCNLDCTCIGVLGMWGTRNELVCENIGKDQLENLKRRWENSWSLRGSEFVLWVNVVVGPPPHPYRIGYLFVVTPPH